MSLGFVLLCRFRLITNCFAKNIAREPEVEDDDAFLPEDLVTDANDPDDLPDNLSSEVRNQMRK